MIIGAVGTVLFFSLLRFVLISYHPILWHDFLVVLGYVCSSIFLFFFGVLFTLSSSASASRKERIKLIGGMVMLVALTIFLSHVLHAYRRLVQSGKSRTPNGRN